MRRLYHYPLSPFSRRVRIFLKEKSLDFELVTENFWERRKEFLALNPAAQVPVLVEESNVYYSDSTAICEYLEESYKDNNLIGDSVNERAEIRRLAGWFNNKFYYEVTKCLLDEKIYNFYRKTGAPNSNAIRAAKTNIYYQIEYLAHLLKKRQWLAGDRFSLADITAASHLSALDYLGDVPWDESREVKDWYMLIKSRPSFRPLLNDRVPGFTPPNYYKALDF